MKLTHLTRGLSWDAIKKKCHGRRLEVIQLLEQFGPLTPFEMAKKAGKAHRSYFAPRCTELSSDGLIITLDIARTDPETGKASAVYALPWLHQTQLQAGFKGRERQGTFRMGESL